MCIGPVSPSLACDDGTVRMDSTLILEFAEGLASPAQSLMPHDLGERKLRPAEILHEPWVERVTGQMVAAYKALEVEIQHKPLVVSNNGVNQAGISTPVVWQFTQQLLPELVPAKDYPVLCALSSQAEALPAFMAAPHGDGTYR